MFLEIWQNSQENMYASCARVSFLIRLQIFKACNFIKKETGTSVFLWILQNSYMYFFTGHLWTASFALWNLTPISHASNTNSTSTSNRVKQVDPNLKAGTVTFKTIFFIILNIFFSKLLCEHIISCSKDFEKYQLNCTLNQQQQFLKRFLLKVF